MNHPFKLQQVNNKPQSLFHLVQPQCRKGWGGRSPVHSGSGWVRKGKTQGARGEGEPARVRQEDCSCWLGQEGEQ